MEQRCGTGIPACVWFSLYRSSGRSLPVCSREGITKSSQHAKKTKLQHCHSCLCCSRLITPHVSTPHIVTAMMPFVVVIEGTCACAGQSADTGAFSPAR